MGCSLPKSIKPTASCLQYQQELTKLKNKNRKYILQNIAALTLPANLPHQEDKQIDEKIRVLEMKLSECHKGQ